jgi:hypothetical protein
MRCLKFLLLFAFLSLLNTMPQDLPVHPNSIFTQVILTNSIVNLTYKKDTELIDGEVKVKGIIENSVFCRNVGVIKCEIPFNPETRPRGVHRDVEYKPPIQDVSVRFSFIDPWYRMLVLYRPIVNSVPAEEMESIPIRLKEPEGDMGKYLNEIMDIEERLKEDNVKFSHAIPITLKGVEAIVSITQDKIEFNKGTTKTVFLTDKVTGFIISNAAEGTYRVDIKGGVISEDMVTAMKNEIVIVKIEAGYLDIIKRFFRLIGKEDILVQSKKMRRMKRLS